MCLTHKPLSSASQRAAGPAEIPDAVKAAPLLPDVDFDDDPAEVEAGGFGSDVQRVIEPPTQKIEPPKKAEKPAESAGETPRTSVPTVPKRRAAASTPKPAPRRAPSQPAKRVEAGPKPESVDIWSRQVAREVSQTMRIGLSKGETRKVAAAVVTALGSTEVMTSDVSHRARQIITEQISAIGEARKREEDARQARVRADMRAKSGPARPAQGQKQNFVVETKGGRRIGGKKQVYQPQYGRYPDRKHTIEEPEKPQLSDAELQRRIAALKAHQKREENGE